MNTDKRIKSIKKNIKEIKDILEVRYYDAVTSEIVTINETDEQIKVKYTYTCGLTVISTTVIYAMNSWKLQSTSGTMSPKQFCTGSYNDSNIDRLYLSIKRSFQPKSTLERYDSVYNQPNSEVFV